VRIAYIHAGSLPVRHHGIFPVDRNDRRIHLIALHPYRISLIVYIGGSVLGVLQYPIRKIHISAEVPFTAQSSLLALIRKAVFPGYLIGRKLMISVVLPKDKSGSPGHEQKHQKNDEALSHHPPVGLAHDLLSVLLRLRSYGGDDLSL